MFQPKFISRRSELADPGCLSMLLSLSSLLFWVRARGCVHACARPHPPAPPARARRCAGERSEPVSARARAIVRDCVRACVRSCLRAFVPPAFATSCLPDLLTS
eukprot:5392554-Pleurochrysis_carterae.AAC.4